MELAVDAVTNPIVQHPLYLDIVKAIIRGRALPKIEMEFGDMLCWDDPEHDPNFRERHWVDDTAAQIALIIEAVEKSDWLSSREG